MWSLEQDPVLRSTFANVTFLDRPADPGRLRDRLLKAVEDLPRLRQRVVDAPGGIQSPSWVDDPLFDIDFHLRRVAVPPPGTERDVLDLAAVLSADPFDRARPLWQFVLVEGVEGGRGAMIQKLHHTITDGEGGVRLSARFLDLERDATEPLDAGRPPREPEPEPARSPFDPVRGPLNLARRAVAEAVETVTNPLGVPGKAGDAVDTARSLLRQVAVVEQARSPLWTERSLRRHLEILSIPLEDAKRAATALGGTVNDLFVAGAAGAAGAYHRARGVEVDLLRMAMPISTRQAGAGAGGNAFAPTRFLVPVGITDPVERFEAVRAVITATKSERALGAAGGVAGVLSALPAPLLLRAARQQVGTVDFTTSNVRGAPFELYFAGARIDGNFPIGPLAGTAFNLTTLSYAGNLDMGCLCDTAAIDDPALLRECLVEAYGELMAAGA